MRTIPLALCLFAPLLLPNYSFATEKVESFQSFINRVLENSNPIKVKVLELEAEGYRAKQTDYFYLPKVSASSKIKNSDNSINSNITATSMVYDSTLRHRFNEKT